MKFNSLTMLGTYDSTQNTKIDGSWTIDPDFEGALKPSNVVSIKDFKKRTVKPWAVGEIPFALVAYPRFWTHNNASNPNVFNSSTIPSLRCGDQVSLIIWAVATIPLLEDFDPASDYNKKIYLDANGKYTKTVPTTGCYFFFGKLKPGSGKIVKAEVDFDNLVEGDPSSGGGSGIDPARVTALESEMNT